MLVEVNDHEPVHAGRGQIRDGIGNEPDRRGREHHVERGSAACPRSARSAASQSTPSRGGCGARDTPIGRAPSAANRRRIAPPTMPVAPITSGRAAIIAGPKERLSRPERAIQS